jgi:N-acetylmuramoyl-L-alanine amidase
VLFRRGDRGPAVAEIRGKLNRLGLLSADGQHASEEFDETCDRAVRGFQQARGLGVDGLVGAETYRALEEARWRLGDRVLTYVVDHRVIGDDVAELQYRLTEMGFYFGRCDGVFGQRTEAALKEFQRGFGLRVDGTFGPRTLKSLRLLERPRVTGGSPQQLHEQERIAAAGPTLAGKVVVLDPGHGGGDPGVRGHGLDEAELAWDIATRLDGRLGALGATSYLTRGRDGGELTDPARARFANDTEADLLVSVHADAVTSPRCHGVSTYYFGTVDPQRAGSVVGRELAGLVQREIVARTDLLDDREHAKTWDLLRLTRMPAVRVEVGYLSNAGDATRLASPELRDTLAEAILVAIQRLYLPEEQDHPTGQLHIPRSAALAG